MESLKIIAITIVFLFVISCSNDDDNPPKHELTTVITVEKENNKVSNYQYDKNAKVMQALSEDKSTVVADYTWSEDKIIKIKGRNIFQTYIVNYTYNKEGKLESEEATDEKSGDLISKKVYTYFPNYYEEKRYDSKGIMGSMLEYYYSPDGLNIDYEKYYVNGDFRFTYNHTYDSKIGLEQIIPYSQFPKAFYNKNNRIKDANIYAGDGTITIINYTIGYNSDNYPISWSRYLDAANTQLLSRTYEYTKI